MCAQISAPSFTLLSSLQEFESLQSDWVKLFEEHGQGTQLFQTFNWNWHWLNHFTQAQSSLRIIAGYVDEELVLLVPLVLKRPLGLKVLEWMGAPVSQYGDILIKPDPSNLHWLTEAFKFIGNTIRPDLFYLRKTRFDATITPLIENTDAKIIEETVAPYIEIRGAENFTEFNKRYSQRSRKSKRRHRRKLEEHGPVEFGFFSEGDDALNTTSKALKLKRQWLKENGIFSAGFSTTEIDNFFKAVAKKNSHPVNLRASNLSVSGNPAAIEIGLIGKQRYGAHIGTYNKEFIQHSPGSLQMQDTISKLIDEQIEIVDLFAPADPYKFEWTDLSTPVYDFAYPVTFIGKIYQSLYLQQIRPALKRIIPKLKKAVNIF